MVETRELLKYGKKKLKESGIDDREARLLLAYVLGARKEELSKYEVVQDRVAIEFKMVIAQRCNGRPFAYIVGHKEFMKLDFEINEDVLIPRADTEILTEKVIEIAKNLIKNSKKDLKILDMCTGSGCIAIAIAKNVRSAVVVATDKSKAALKVAKKNARKNDVDVEFVESDLFKAIKKSFFKDDENRFDIIVSNPPYIETNEIKGLQKEVKDNEPRMALDGGEDGLSFYRTISEEAKKYIKNNGILAYEIGYNQGEAVAKILRDNGYTDVEVIKDYSDNDRVVIAKMIFD